MADRLVRHDEDRDAVGFGEVEGLDGEIEALLRRIRHQRDDAVVAVRTPARLHHVLLRGERRQTGGGTAALHVGEHHRRLHHAGEPDGFHHQREAGAGGDGHHLLAAPDRADIGGDRRDLVFHLDEEAANFRAALGEALRRLGRRRDRIAGEEAATGGKRSFGERMVPIHEVAACQNAFWICWNRLRKFGHASIPYL